MKKVVVPAGIGDWSWIWSKLWSVQDEFDCIGVVDGWPQRTLPYVELCVPPEKRQGFCEYVPLDYKQIQWQEQQNGMLIEPGKVCPPWSHAKKGWEESQCIYLEANRHLELGKPLADWLPDLPTHYHYPLYTSNEDRTNALNFIRTKVYGMGVPESKPLLGISCASYRGSEAWKTWGREEWIEFLTIVMQETPFQPVLLGGFWDDLTHAVASTLKLPDLVGITSVAEGVEVLGMLDSYIGFSSGLNVIRTVQDLPVMALWPEHQLELSYSWAPPDMVKSQRYVGSLWHSVSKVMPIALNFLELCVKEMVSEDRYEESNQSESPQKVGNGTIHQALSKLPGEQVH